MKALLIKGHNFEDKFSYITLNRVSVLVPPGFTWFVHLLYLSVRSSNSNNTEDDDNMKIDTELMFKIRKHIDRHEWVVPSQY